MSKILKKSQYLAPVNRYVTNMDENKEGRWFGCGGNIKGSNRQLPPTNPATLPPDGSLIFYKSFPDVFFTRILFSSDF